MKIVIIDNYDSFVYNLSHAIKELGAEVTVKRNDQFRLEELEEFGVELESDEVDRLSHVKELQMS